MLPRKDLPSDSKIYLADRIKKTRANNNMRAMHCIYPDVYVFIGRTKNAQADHSRAMSSGRSDSNANTVEKYIASENVQILCAIKQ